MAQAPKIVVVGPAGVGKTQAIKGLITSKLEKKYVPTVGVEVHAVDVPECGEFGVNLWDTAGNSKLAGLRDGYYIGAQGAVVFIRGEVDLNKYEDSIKDIRRVAPGIPVAVVTYTSDIAKDMPSTFVENTRIFWVQNTPNSLQEPLCWLLKTIRGAEYVMERAPSQTSPAQDVLVVVDYNDNDEPRSVAYDSEQQALAGIAEELSGDIRTVQYAGTQKGVPEHFWIYNNRDVAFAGALLEDIIKELISRNIINKYKIPAPAKCT